MAIYDIAAAQRPIEPVSAFLDARSQGLRDNVTRNAATQQEQQIAQHEQEAPLRESNQQAQMGANDLKQQQNKQEMVVGQIKQFQEMVDPISSAEEYAIAWPKIQETFPSEALEGLTGDYEKDQDQLAKANDSLNLIVKSYEESARLRARAEAPDTPGEQRAIYSKAADATDASLQAQMAEIQAQEELAQLEVKAAEKKIELDDAKINYENNIKGRSGKVGKAGNPTKQDLEYATSIIDDDAMFDELPGETAEKASKWVAYQAKQLQASNPGMSYPLAVALAHAEARGMVTPEEEIESGKWYIPNETKDARFDPYSQPTTDAPAVEGATDDDPLGLR